MLPRTLTFRLAVSNVMMAIVTGAAVSWGTERAAVEQFHRASRTHLRELAATMTDRLDRSMFERQQDITLLASLSAFRDARSTAERETLLNALKAQQGTYAWIGYATPGGRVQAATGGLLRGADVHTRPWHQGGLQAPYAGDVHSAALLAGLLPQRGTPLRFVDLAAPIRDDQGRVTGVLGAHLAWNWAEDTRRSLLRQADQTDMLILSRAHTVLLGPPDLLGQTLKLRVLTHPGAQPSAVTWPDGRTYLTAVQPSTGHQSYPGLGWTVVARQDLRVTNAAAQAFRTQVLLCTLAVTLLFALVGVWRAYVIAAPLRRLTRAARQLDAGDEHVHLPHLTDYTEVELLSRTLAQTVSTLEARVQARTQALSVATTHAQVLADLSRTSMQPLSPDDVAQQACALLSDPLSLDWAGLAHIHGDRIEQDTTWTRGGVHPLTDTRRVLPRGTGLAWQVFERKEAHFIDDYAAQPGAVPEFVQWGARSSAFIPIAPDHSGAHILIVARRDQHTWTPEERTLLTAAAHVLSVAFERHAHQAYLARAALEDRLTGLGNRRAFDTDLDVTLAASLRHEHPVAVLILDLNGLKHINDTHGHDRGDEMLRAFARALQDAFRASDRVYRLGGDEYAVLLTHAQTETQDVLLRRVRAAEQLTRAAGFPDISASCGAAFYPAERQSGRDLVRLADQRMYSDKRSHARR